MGRGLGGSPFCRQKDEQRSDAPVYKMVVSMEFPARCIAGEPVVTFLRLKVHRQHIIHHRGLAKIGSGNKEGLLSGFGGSFDQNATAYLRSDIPRFSVFHNIDNQPNGAVASVTRLPCFAVRKGDTDKSWRRNRGSLCAQLR